MADLKKTADLLRKAVQELERMSEAPASTNELFSNPRPGPSRPVFRSGNTVSGEIRRLFSPYAGGRKTSGKQPKWSHKFYCLGVPNQDAVPDKLQKKLLNDAGLGERKLFMTKNQDPGTLKSVLLTTFPKLANGGGFELLRSTSRVCLDVIDPPSCGYTSHFLAEESGVGAAIIYVRPLQKELDLSPVKVDSEPDINCPLEECIECGKSFPVILLRKHIEECHEESDEELPTIKRKNVLRDRPICDFACVTGNESDNKSTSEKPDSLKECPLCLKEFSKDLLQVHASTCGEEYRDSSSTNPRCLQDLLQTISLSEERWEIPVIRRNIVKNTFQQVLEAEESDWNKRLNITFIGEEGVDSGGLTREFFTLMFEKVPVFSSGLFNLDAAYIEKRHYFWMGRLTALAIIYGHPGPRCLHEYMVDYILTEKMNDLSDLPITLVGRQDIVNAVNEIYSLENISFESAERYGDILEAAGFHKVLNGDTKEEAVKALKNHYLLYRLLPCVMQFREGLRLHGILDMLKQFQEEAKVYLRIENKVSVSEVMQFFKPAYSEELDQKQVEEEIVYNFNMFLKKLDKGSVTSIWASPDTEEDEKTCIITVQDLLKALVGCPAIPKNISSGLIAFDHESKKISTVNTCAPSINFSRLSDIQDYSQFEKLMKDIVIGSYGFGME